MVANAVIAVAQWWNQVTLVYSLRTFISQHDLSGRSLGLTSRNVGLAGTDLIVFINKHISTVWAY